MKHETYEHGLFVEAWLKEPTWLPQTDLARVGQVVHQTPQRRSRLPRLATERFRPMLSATTIAAGVAVIALTGAILIDGLMPDASTNARLPAAHVEATATVGPEVDGTALNGTVISLPETLPAGLEGVDVGTVDTPIGPARWVSVTGPMDELPRLGSVVPWGDGLAIWAGRHRHPDGRIGSLWASSDGTEWRSVALPEDYSANDSQDRNVELAHADGALYLAHPRLDRIWRSTTDGGWRALDTSAITQARPAGWASGEARIYGAETVDGELVFRVEHGYTLPRQRLGFTRRASTRHMQRVGPGRYALCQPGKNECSASGAPMVVRFKQADDGLVVRDDRTGERLGLLAGADLSELYEGQGAVTRNAFELRDDELVPTAWPADDGEGREQPPTGVPAAGEALRLDSGWVAWEYRDQGYAPPAALHMHIGGEWVDLDTLGFPTHLRDSVEWGVDGVGNAAVFWFANYQDRTVGLWVLTVPDGA